MPEKPTEPPAAAPVPAAGGVKAWLPLMVTLVAMPALAYGTMSFLILPKMKQAAAAPAADHASGSEAEGADDDTGGPGEAAGGHGTGGAESSAATASKGRVSVRLEKVVVNVAGTLGTRFLMASVTLVGTGRGFKETIEANQDQLMDLTTSTLSSKTIADLEKPGARNLIKTELISVINNALGQSLVKEIYIPEMAIQ